MAKWKLFDGEKAPQCTSCGMWMSFARYKKKTGVNGRNITNYCPSCGAKMNGIDECLTCKYAKDGEWKDNGICFACRDITWTFGTPQNIDIK